MASACAYCGGEVPPPPRKGGMPRKYCSPKCCQKAQDNVLRYTRQRGCPHCAHCQQRLQSQAPPEWVVDALAELREARAKVAQAAAELRDALQRRAV